MKLRIVCHILIIPNFKYFIRNESFILKDHTFILALTTEKNEVLQFFHDESTNIQN